MQISLYYSSSFASTLPSAPVPPLRQRWRHSAPPPPIQIQCFAKSRIL